jgi:hypothetical protein
MVSWVVLERMVGGRRRRRGRDRFRGRSPLLAPSGLELGLDPLADVVVAVSVFEQLHRSADSDPKDHLEHRFVFEFKIDVEGLFKLVNANGLDRFSFGTAKRNLRVTMPERHRGA